MVSKAAVLSSVSFRQTENWNIKQFFNATAVKTSFPLKRIGDALERRKDPLLVKDGKLYRRITIKTGCGGVVVRDEVPGETIKTKHQYRIHSGQLAVSKIDARNGAFGIVPPEADGAIITGNFWVYDVDPAAANSYYLILLLSSNVFVQAWQDCSNGSGNRLYLQEAQFLDYQIPLPSPSMQAELVASHLSSLEKAESLERQAASREDALERQVFAALGITRRGGCTADSPLRTVRFQSLRQWGYDKLAVGFPFLFEKYKAFSFSSRPNWLVEICRGKSPVYAAQGTSVILNQKCNRKNEIDLQYAKRVNDAWLSAIPAHFLTRKGDLLINSTGEGTLGRASVIVSDAHAGLAYDSHLLLLRVNPDAVCPSLLAYLFNSSFGQAQVNLYKSAQATKQTELGIENTLKLQFPLPPLPVQQEIADGIARETQRVKALREQAKQLRLDANSAFSAAVFGA